jgi:hypothetical protein
VRGLALAAAVSAAGAALTGPVAASAQAAPAAVDTAQVTPGGAFLRALLVPGWGHASIGAHTRGGFYVATQSATTWMIVRTVSRLSAAKDVRDQRRARVAERLASAGITDPREVAEAQAADPAVQAALALVEARGQQFEDWLALGLFLAFLSGADAFVSAHLRDFPEPLGLELHPSRGGASVGVSLPLGGGRPRR